jgi:hypothetical protein
VPPAADDSEAAQFDAMGFAAKVFRVVAAHPDEFSYTAFTAVNFGVFCGLALGNSWYALIVTACVGVPMLICQTFLCW